MKNKNVWVIPTDKPSRLYLTTHEYIFESGYSYSTDECQNKHIYITSDEEIKEGDWYYLPRTNSVHKCIEATELNLERRLGVAKIILTTDGDLIKDGVQAIDDEFLEWFVKNPSCEEVEVKIECTNCDDCNCQYHDPCLKPKYNIVKDMIRYSKEEPKQETLEEVAERFYGEEEIVNDYDISGYLQSAFLTGAKWQMERSYSEEEVEEIIAKLMHEVHCGDICYGDKIIDFKISPRKWFNQLNK